MLFFRLTLVPIQEGKMGDAISYAEEKVDEFMEVPGLLQVALCENSDGQLMSWSTWLCLLYTSPSPRDYGTSRMPSSA